LAEYGSIWRSGIALCGYILTQMCKLLVIASVMLPPAPLDYAIDCFGMYYVLTKQQKASLAEVKILSVALGWSFAESLLTRFVDFYVNARSLQFDWKYLLIAADANFALLQNVSMCTLLWLSSRGSRSSTALIVLYLIALTFVSNTFSYKAISIALLAGSTLFVAN